MTTANSKIMNEHKDQVEKWQLPSMDSGSRKVFRRAQKTHTEATAGEDSNDLYGTAIPTAEEIEQWHQQAHDEGYQQGMIKAVQ